MKIMKTSPAVFAVGNSYHIMVPVECESIMWVKVGDENYYDESNGIMRSKTYIHRMIVPKDKLDSAKEYTVCLRRVIDRKPYFPETEDEENFVYKFKPVEGDKIRLFHIADTHNMIEQPYAAAKAYGDIDLLVMNGDIPDHSGTQENILNVYYIAEKITGGRIPIVFARGNHDMRGAMAENFAEYTPNENGCTYYSFRMGDMWGLVLDCGEDKDDSSEAYGYMVACHDFRLRQTEYIKKVIANAENEYAADGVKYKVVIAHNPFTKICNPPFDIETEIYSQWVRLLREEIKPDMILCGHLHKTTVIECGSEEDAHGQPCPVVIGAKPVKTENGNHYIGAGISLDGEITVSYVDSNEKLLEEITL